MKITVILKTLTATMKEMKIRPNEVMKQYRNIIGHGVFLKKRIIKKMTYPEFEYDDEIIKIALQKKKYISEKKIHEESIQQRYVSLIVAQIQRKYKVKITELTNLKKTSNKMILTFAGMTPITFFELFGKVFHLKEIPTQVCEYTWDEEEFETLEVLLGP